MNPARQVVVVAGDATLTRLATTAANAFERLARERIAIVICSSKTRAQIERVQQELGFAHPFVAECGAACFSPPGYFGFEIRNARRLAGREVVEFGRPYHEIVGVLRRTAKREGVEVVGFDDMTVEDVANRCGMSLVEARLAKLREYAEPFQLALANPVARGRLLKALRGTGLGCWRCDEFDHAGALVDLRSTIDSLMRFFRRSSGPVCTVGLVDRGPGCWQHVPQTVDQPEPEPFEATDITLVVEAQDTGSRWAPMRPVGRVSPCDWADAVLEIDASLKRGCPVDR
jgi:mannosyl-3-phosphoglycerate phosphatase